MIGGIVLLFFNFQALQGTILLQLRCDVWQDTFGNQLYGDELHRDHDSCLDEPGGQQTQEGFAEKNLQPEGIEEDGVQHDHRNHRKQYSLPGEGIFVQDHAVSDAGQKSG